MTLRKKTLLMVCSALGIFLTGLFVYSRQVIAVGFAKLEEREARLNVERVRDFFGSEVENLKVKMADWAAWDDCYKYLADANKEFEKSNFNPATMGAMKLHMLSFWKTDGSMVYGTQIDIEHENLLRPIADADLKFIAHEKWFHEFANLEDVKSGLVQLSTGAYLVSSHPVVTSAGTGPIRGALVSARRVHEGFFEKMSKVTHLDVQPMNERDLKLAGPLSSQVAVTRILGEELLGAYTVIHDIFDKPMLTVRVQMPREVHAQGKHSSWLFLMAAGLVGLGLIVLIVAILEGFVLAPISRVTERIRDIGKSANWTLRLNHVGRDEIAILAGSTNLMLDSLEESQKRLKRLMDNTGQGFLSFDKNGHIGLECSKAVAQFFGREAAGLPLTELMDANAQPWPDVVDLLFNTNLDFADLTHLCPAQIEVGNLILKTEYHEVKDGAGNRVQILMVLSDISTLLQLEERGKKEQRRNRMLLQVLTHKNDFLDFRDMSQELAAKSGDSREFLRALHTLKGGLAYLACDDLVQLCHSWESKLGSRPSAREMNLAGKDIGFSMDQFAKDYGGILGLDGSADRHIAISRSKLEESLLRDPAMWRAVNPLLERPLEDLLKPLSTSLQITSDRLAKRVHPLKIDNSLGVNLIPELHASLLQSFLHVVRNAVAHGIEAPEEREKFGKDPSGTFIIRTAYRDSFVELNFEDDGRGPDFSKLALLTGDATQKISLDALFRTGVTTQDKEDEFSGRGVGLDVVRSQARAFGGDVEAYVTPTGGFGLRLWFLKRDLRSWNKPSTPLARAA